MTGAEEDSKTLATRPIALTAIERDPDQARARFNDAALDELAGSISRNGLMQPIVVVPLPGSPGEQRYRLIAGERRWRAAARAGLPSLPAIVRADLDRAEATTFGLIENLQRESLGVMETAHGLARLGDEFGLTHEAIAARIGKSRAFVTNFLRLTQLAEAVQRRVEDGDLNLGHAKILVGLARPQQIELAQRTVRQAWSVRRLEAAAREANAWPAESGTAAADELSDMERKISAALGNQTRVLYQSTTGRGELRIQFHSLDEFDGLLQRLGCSDP